MTLKPDIKALWRNTFSSWITTTFGSVVGVPVIVAQIDLWADGDPSTALSVMTLIQGVAAVLLGIFARDGDTTSAEVIKP